MCLFSSYRWLQCQTGWQGAGTFRDGRKYWWIQQSGANCDWKGCWWFCGDQKALYILTLWLALQVEQQVLLCAAQDGGVGGNNLYCKLESTQTTPASAKTEQLKHYLWSHNQKSWRSSYLAKVKTPDHHHNQTCCSLGRSWPLKKCHPIPVNK